MPDLLLELFSEEIPARMQGKAAEDLRKGITDGLVAAGLTYDSAKAFATPRRLALVVGGLPVRSPDQREEKKGPRVGAPDAAIQGFLKSAGLTSIDEATIQPDGKKGEVYIALIKRPGRATIDILSELIPAIIRSFPWPKSMRWGAASVSSSSLRWVRPLTSILCTFGPETEETTIVPVAVDGIVSGNLTYGHRFMAPQAITVSRFADYAEKLLKAKVVLDAGRRKAIILAEARTLCAAQNLDLIEDEALAQEVAGLVEWPVVLMGRFDEAFLAIPGDVIRATIRANQKCFVVREPQTGALANRFVLTANIEASDQGAAIIAGNERVVRARLSDARHFWQTDLGLLPDAADYVDEAEALGLDLSKPLDQRMGKLAHLDVVFHQKLGTQGARVKRIVALARAIAELVGADPELAARAASLAKADLTSEMVGEFPELQGLMGRRYAELQGEHPSVSAAIEEHYRPLGPGDQVPDDPVAIAVALADKLDTLVGFWAIDEKPTGSKDPYALRRAALGVIRIFLENRIALRLNWLFNVARAQVAPVGNVVQQGVVPPPVETSRLLEQRADLLAFFHDRLKVQLRDQGARHDLVDAVLGSRTPLLPLWEKVSAQPTDEGETSKTTPHPASGHPLPQGERVEGMPGKAVLGSRTPLLPSQEKVSAQPTDEGETSKTTPHPASGHPLPQGEREERSAASDDLLLIVRRVEALTLFLKTEDGANLLQGYKRAVNILKAEEKKDGAAFDGVIDKALIAARGAPEEQALATAIGSARDAVSRLVEGGDYAGALGALSALRPAVDAFFEKILVNDPDARLRANRLNLLASLRATALPVADFGLIAG